MARLLAGVVLFSVVSRSPVVAQPLTTLTYHLTGTELRVSPAVVSVPKGIAGSVLVQLVGADGTNGATAELAQGAYVEATLRGPSFDARRVVGAVNAAMLLPPLNLVGDYQLDNIRLVDAVTGVVRLEGNPPSVPVRVFDEVLVTKVTSRPLTYEEIQEKGIYIDEQNFRAVEFEAAFVVDGKTIPVKFPVVAPVFQQNTELIPKAEMEAKLAEAQIINQGIAATAVLPPELETASFNIHIEPVLFQEVQDVEEELTLTVPPIPALVVIPGNIGFLNQFFSVMVLTENAAPSGSGLSAHNIRANIVLPPGPDHVPAPDYSQPGDDPLRLARVGPDKATQPTVLVVRPGQDGQFGTGDDIGRLQPGEQGQGEFLVEGLQEGLHVMDINLTADLDGLAAGTVSITGKAAGSVLVRNPKFSMAFTHPRTVRTGEEYDASVTILNTGTTPANQVSVTLAGASLSGGVLLSEETILLGNLEPGQSATATWRVRSQRTGAISFSNLTTGHNSVEGRFRFTVGVDERGVALSPDTLAMPSHTQHLPSAILNAAQRVLGQALSIATAGQLPPGVKAVPKSIITRRVLELAEAGQRLAYGDATNRVLADVLLDWQGARSANEGFDEILRVTNAGREWREAVMAALDAAEEGDATTRLLSRSLDMAGRGETWKLAASSTPAIELSLVVGDAQATLDRSELPFASAYRGARGHWLVSPPAPSPLTPLPSDGRGETNCVFEWKAVEAVDSAELAALLLATNGTVRQLRWSVSNVVAGTRFRLPVTDTAGNLQVDTNADDQPAAALPATVALVTERQPEFISVRQDTTVNSGRPTASCLNANAENYGTVVAVLFSKPMRQEDVSTPGAYLLDNGITASTVQIQPGGRVALLNLKQGISAIRPRAMTISGVRDPRGHLLAATTRPVLTDFYSGSTLYGRVVRADGSPATNVPVTLTMYDQKLIGNTGDCLPHTMRVSQVFTDAEGKYAFDFVLAGIPYSVSATDTAGLSEDEVGAVTESTVGGEVSRSRLESWLQNAINRNPLFGMFSVSTLPEAIAKVDGLDRAMLRDLIPLGSAREGGETPIALRFRGRGAITGQVLASDGVTPVPRAAVNLYPDPGSRELPRGVFSDSNGRCAFVGVPLGVFSISAQSSAGQYRTVGVELLDIDETKEVPIVLAAPIVQRTGLRGRVFESDGATPHARARVFVGRYENGTFGNAIAAVDTDLDGFWSATNIVAGTYDVVAVSFDGRRKGDRRGIAAPAGEVGYVSVSLQGTAIVKGKVEFATGKPVAGAIVAGGEVLVYTDANGLFTLTGVPTGARTISAGLARNPAAGILTPRIGSASVNVVPGADNGVLIRFDSRGRIVGTVYDATGTNPVPNVRVAIPGGGGFMYVDADGRGRYAFENMGMGGYTVSAPGGPVAQRSTGHLIEKIKSGTEEEVEAAIGEAFAIFTGASNPYLNGAGANFNPNTWGFTSARLEYDGQTVQANIIYLRQGTIAGKVLNGQGVPIGAKVMLTGVAPMPNGAPGTRIRGEMNSDPATGEFRFPNAVFEGLWQLQAASPFYPSVVTHSDLSFPPANLDHTNIVLAFSPVHEVNGRLIGHVLNPDGTPAGTNVSVRISFGDLTLRTVEDGFFDTQIAIPAGSYSVIATNEEGLVGIAGVSVTAGITNACSVRLLGKGALRVTVRHANGVIATNARVEIAQGGFPNDTAATAPLPAGEFLFANLFEGSYGVHASKPSGPVTIKGRAGATVTPGETNAVTVVLQSTAFICGRFLKRDGVTPIYAAQVAIGNIGFAITDTNGAFTVDGVPLGTYRIVSQDPVNGWGAQTYVTLSVDGECRQLTLLEQSRGELWGYVINSYATGYVPGALVSLAVSDGLTPPRQVTTGPDGLFRFPATPAADFTVSAYDNATRRGGATSGTLPENTSSMQVDVPLQPLARLAGYVYLPDGTNPANARVEISGPGTHSVGFTDPTGRVAFADLPLGAYTLRATDTRTGFERSLAVTQTDLNQMGQAPDFRLQLAGVGRVAGALVFSDGVRPMQAAVVTLVHQAPGFAGQRDTTFTDAQGRFAFDNVPVGPYALTAEFFALGAAHAGAIARNDQTDFVTMRLGDSGEVVGQLFRADGVTAVTNLDVWLAFQSQSTVPGYAIEQTGSDGSFHFFNIPVGEFTFHAVAYDFDGLALQRATLWFNLQILNLGIITLDEAPPTVESVFPADGASGVAAGIRPVLMFSEALDPTTLDDRGLYLHSRHGDVPVTLQLEQTNGVARRVRIVPLQPLASETTYDLVVLHRPYRGGRVVTDLVGRPLSTPFVARFTTQDIISPTVVSVFPTNGAVQIDPRAVVRVAFNEPVQDRHIQCALVGPGGPVPGKVSVGFNGLVVAFVPDAPLAVNARHTLQLSGVLDLAGNPMVPVLVESSFDTLDTTGPTIQTLRLADGRLPVAGAVVPFEAVLVADEPGAGVRFTRDFHPAGLATRASYRANIPLPASGSTTVRAYASDRYGNEGEFAELTVAVVSNAAPVVQLARVMPASGPVGSSRTFTLRLGATDDYVITNVTVVFSGALNEVRRFDTGDARDIEATVPAQSVAGATLRVSAQALDGLGAASELATLDLPVEDRSAPALQFVAPAAGAQLDPAQPFVLQVAASDNGTNYFVEAALGGALTASQSTNIVAATNQPVSAAFIFNLAGAQTNGDALFVALRGWDTLGNTGLVTRTFRLPDRAPPRLLAVTPTNGAPAQSLWLDTVRFEFTEAIASNSLSRAQLEFTNNAGLPVGHRVALESDARFAQMNPTNLPLAPGVTFSNRLLTGVTDLDGNALAQTNGEPWPAEGAVFTFTTAALLEVSPTNGQPVVPGQLLAARLGFERELGADFIGFALNTNPPVEVPLSPGATNAAAALRLPTNASSASLVIAAHKSGRAPYTLPAVVLPIRPREADDDGDGWNNGYEADRGMNPFVAEPDGADPDGDSLVNADERARGTDPSKPDTDDDDLRDGAEIALGTNPLDPDTDHDTLPDGSDPDPLRGDAAPVIAAPAPPATMEVISGRLTNVIVSTSDADLNLRELQALAANSDVTLRWEVNDSAEERVLDVHRSLRSIRSDACSNCLARVDVSTPPVLPATLLGQSYNASLTATGGVSPYTFAVTSGALPGGLHLSSDGRLSGFAKNTGFTTFTVRVTDALGLSAGQLFGLRVAEGALPPTNAAPQVFTLATNAAQLTTPLLLSALAPGTSTVQIIARDVTGLRSTNALTLIALADADLDGIPDRDDPDADGDGLANASEIAQGTDPLKTDTDGDGLPDNLDAAPAQPNQPPVPAFAEGRPALLLDGVDDFAQKDNASLAVNIGWSNFTVSAWVQTTNRVEAYQCVVSRYEFGWGWPDGNAQAIWVIYVNPEGKPMFGVRGDTGPWVEAVGSSDVRDGQWHHLAGVLDRIAGTLVIYVDGVPAATNAASDIGPVNDSGSPLSVGRIFRQGWGSPGEYYMGAIADLRIWAAARTLAELLNDMTQPPPTTPSPLKGYWTFDEPFSSAQAADRTTNGNPLALGGGAHLRRLVPQTGTAPHLFTLAGTDPDGGTPRAVLTSLPAFGALYQTSDGVTRGARITNALALVSDPAGRVILVPTPGARRDYDFRWKLTDTHAWSAEMAARLELQPLSDVDTDGDGLPDTYEFTHFLDPEADDSGSDLDGDGLTNEREYLHGTRPDVADTDNDWTSDGLELARGTDPFQRDSDGDGLVDSEDPQPTNIVAGVTFTAPSEVTLDAGGSTNIAFTATCPGTPIALADFWPTNLPPAFASLLQFWHTNDGANGVIHGVLALNPLHDALGEHVISLRAAGKNGMSGGWDLKVTVVEGARIDVTHWYQPVSGDWSDPTKWSAGVPDATKFALINATGATYTVTLNTSADCRGLVVDAPKVTLSAPAGGRSISGPVELRRGQLRQEIGSGLTLGRSLHNAGIIRLPSANGTAGLYGSGWIENLGLVEVVSGQGNGGSWSEILVPFRNAGSGRFVVRAGGRLQTGASGRIISSGQIELEYDAYLWPRFDDRNTPLSALLVHSGCQVRGPGVPWIRDASRVFMAGDMNTGSSLDILESGNITGPGTLTLEGSRGLNGTYDCPVVFASSARAQTYWRGQSGSFVRFLKPVTFQAGAEVTIHQAGQMEVADTLDNYGALRVASKGSFSVSDPRCDFGVLFGSGTITNHALLEIYDAADTAGECPGSINNARAQLQVNVTVPVGGQLLVGSNAHVRAFGGKILRIGGQFEFQSGGWLALESGRLVLEEGVRVEGPGSIDIGTANLVMEGNATVACPLNFSRSTHHSWPFVQGSGVLTLEGPQGLYGTFACPVVFSGTVRASTDHGGADISVVHFAQPAVILPGAVLTVHQGGQLDVQSALDNYGTLRVASKGSFSSSGVRCDFGLLYGNGSVTNHGLLEIYDADDTAGECPGSINNARAQLQVNVTVPAGGQLLVGSDAHVRAFGGKDLRIGGQFEFQSGGWLALESGRLVLEEGVRVEGPGSLSIGDELIVEGNATIACPLSMMGAYGGRTASGNGTLTLEGPQSLSGTFICPVIFGSSARAATYFGFVGSGLPNAGTIVRFDQPVIIEPGAEVIVHQTGQLNVSSTLDNYGTIRVSSMGSFPVPSSSSCDNGTLSGTGRIINHSLLEVFDATNGVAGCDYAWAILDVNLTLPLGGRLLLSGNSWVKATKDIRLGTPPEFVSGGRPSVIANSGPQVDGTGTLTFDTRSGARLIMDGDATMACGFELGDGWGGASAVGAGVLTLTRSQTLMGTFGCPVVLASGVQAGVPSGSWESSWYWGSPTVWFTNRFTIHEGAVLDVNNVGIVYVGDILENRGVLRMASNGDRNAGGLTGPGHVLNHGLLEVYDAPQTSGNPQVPARLNSDLTVFAGSRLVVGTNASAFAEASRTLRVGGQMEIQPGGSLALDAGQLALETGVRVEGAGALTFRGGSRLLMDGDATVACAFNLGVSGPCLATGDGVLTLEGPQHLVGRYSCPVVLASNLNAYVDYTFSTPVTFSNKLTMVSNAVLRVERHGRLHLNCLMENAGHLHLESRDSATVISSDSEGCVRNSGLIEVFATGAGGEWSEIHVPLVVGPSGRLLVNTNAYLQLSRAATLALAGRLEVAPGARFAQISSPTPLDLILYAGARLGGGGLMELHPSGRLVVLANATLESGQLRLLGSTTMAGRGRLLIEPDAEFFVDHSLTFPGSIETRGLLRVASAPVVLQTDGTFVLATSGTLDNPGTVRVGSYVNLGGTIIGNAPVLIGGSPGGGARFTWLGLGESSADAGARSPDPMPLVLVWTAPAGTHWVVEHSTDLVRWSTVPAEITETGDRYEARLGPMHSDRGFYRVRLVQ